MPLELDRAALEWFAVAGVALGALALLLALAAHRRVARLSRRPRSRQQLRRVSAGGTDPRQLRADLDALAADLAASLRNIQVVRYDAFGDLGGHLSWSMALLDDAGDGVVLTSIHGRSDSRTYAKNVRQWSSEQQLSPEEREAIDRVSGALAA